MDATLPARDALMEKLMRANSLLLQMQKYAEKGLPVEQEGFAVLLPHLESVLTELATYVFFAPPSAECSTQNLIDYMVLNQEQTLDIYRFEAYSYLIGRLS